MRILLLALCLFVPACASASAYAQPAGPPAWWVAHVEFVSRDGGVWVSPNPQGENDPDAPDAFAMHWRRANDGYALLGRLYGLRNGEEIAEYWTFIEFWHPGERRAVVQQWSAAGAYGVGESRWENGEGVLVQTFWLPDGRSWREGHRNRENGDEYVTHAFDISETGEWTSKDPRVWRRSGSAS